MLRKVSRCSLIQVIAMFAVVALPRMADAAEGWTGYGKVLEVYPSSSGTFYFSIDVSSNPGPCANSIWFSNPGTGDGANRVFASLLSAQASGASVRVYVTGACDTWGYHVISSTSVKSN